MSEHTHDIDSQVRSYMVVFAALMGLTVITVAISYLDLFTPAAITLALTVALIKGTLVAGVFMHLFDEKKIIYAVLVLTVSFFLVLMLLPVISDGDHVGESQEATAAAAAAAADDGHHDEDGH